MQIGTTEQDKSKATGRGRTTTFLYVAFPAGVNNIDVYLPFMYTKHKIADPAHSIGFVVCEAKLVFDLSANGRELVQSVAVPLGKLRVVNVS